MYWTPCARLMKSITPNTSVRPAAIRNNRTPSCSPLRIWTTRSVVDTVLLHRAVLGVRIGIILEYLLHNLGLELAVGALGDLDQIEILDRIVVGVELEAAPQRLEVSLHHGGAQRIFVADVALYLPHGAVDQQSRVVGLERVGRRHRAE